jgi:hypothetical protein
MSALQYWHRAILIVLLAGLAVTVLAWIAPTDPAINYLPRHRGADWIVFPTAVILASVRANLPYRHEPEQ